MSLSLLLSLACTRRSAGGPEPIPTREGYVQGAGEVRLYYRLEGSGPDTVVILHGGPGLNMNGLRPDLTPLERRHALLYYDQRGGGRSDLPDSLDLTADAMVDDLEAVRQAFRMEQLTLLGHSWGGGLAPLYAMRYPDHVRRMVLVGPIGPRGQPYLSQYGANQNARRDSSERRRMEAFDSLLEASAGAPEVCRHLMRLFLRGVAGTPENAAKIKGDYCAVFGSFVHRYPELDYDWSAQAARLAIPTLVVHGTADPLPIAAAEEWTDVLPEARLVAIPGAGHYPQAEAPERFFPAVERFLAGEWPPDVSQDRPAAPP